MHRTFIRLWLGLLGASLVVSLAACSGGGGASPTATSAGDAAHGQTLFAGTCASCHGPDGTGITGLGKDLTTSTFVAEQSDPQLLDFLKTGRPAADPLNTTGIDMPPRGGNPALTDEDLADIISYLRTIHQ